ncbi:YlaF family protein [Savagea faecisuis]|uniref:YlaF family protein n=1 Tax=Savagea faecisuis TaxID=1274803 RepID=A0ABW3H1X6_9BACL
MKNIQWIFVLYSFLAVSSMCAIGVGVAEKSPLTIIISSILVLVFMGLGFMKKKKLREQGLL